MFLHGGVECGLHHPFTLGIECAGGFVQQQQRRVFQDGACNRNTLALAARQAYTTLTQKGAVPLGQGQQEVVCKSGLGGGMYFGVAGVGFAVADVFQRGGRENHRVLRHHTDAAAQAVQRQVADVHTIQRDAPTRRFVCAARGRVRVVKALQQLEHRTFARAAGSHQCHCFASRHLQVKAV